MKNILLTLSIFTLLIFSCEKEKDAYLITKSAVGLLTDSTKVKDLKFAFPEDSIVNNKAASGEFLPSNAISIFDSSGKKVLLLTPKNANDPESTIETVSILDSRYKTEKNINLNSSFKEISAAYKFSKIENTLRNLVIFINPQNIFFTIDKSELPGELQFNTDTKIDAVQIPDNAKLKYFMLNWD